MNNKLYTTLCIATIWLFAGCTSNNDAKPDDSGFFVKLFGGAKNETPFQIIPLTEGGYAGIGLTESYSTEGRQDMFFFLIDKLGNVTKQIGIGGDVGRSIRRTPDSGFIIFGDSLGVAAKRSACIIKTTKEGVVQWRKEYRPAETPLNAVVKGVSIENNLEGGYLILGSVEVGNNSTLFVTKIDATGSVLRERTYGLANSPNAITSIVQNATSDIAVGGTLTNFSPANSTDMRVVLTNSLANLKWDYAFNKNLKDIGVDLQLLPNGYALLGTTTTNNGTTDIVLNRLNEAGEATLSVVFGGEGNQVARSVAPTQDGGFIVIGDIEKPGIGASLQTDLYITKLSYAGEIEWTKTFGSSENDISSIIRQDADGNYIILATIGFVTTKMCGVIRLNAKGQFLK